jgi:hypothetical protein
MGPPPKKSRVGLVLGIVGGVVVLIVGGLVALGVLGWQIEKSLPKAENKLTLPGTLVDGQYKFAEKMPASQTDKIENEANSAWDAEDIHALGARYDRGGDPAKGLLVVSSMYGRFKHEADVRHGMLKGAADADGVTLVQPEKDATPPGAQTTITCEVVSQQESLVTVTYPICAWADGNTAAVVGEIDVEHKDASDVDIAAAARDTLTVRSEMIKPAN